MCRKLFFQIAKTVLMQLPNKLFTIGRKKTDRDAAERPAEAVACVLNCFNEDLRQIRLGSFTEGKSEIPENGKVIQTYHKELQVREYGIFRAMSVRLEGYGLKVTFHADKPQKVARSRIRKMIDDLYECYGPDQSGKEYFNAEDAVAYADEQDYIFFGRDWMDARKYRYPLVLQRDEQKIMLSVWGLDKNSII